MQKVMTGSDNSSVVGSLNKLKKGVAEAQAAIFLCFFFQSSVLIITKSMIATTTNIKKSPPKIEREVLKIGSPCKTWFEGRASAQDAKKTAKNIAPTA